ncbi:hypothetical protein Q669_10935 [Labrenzia sp. C1B10]|nr:hypothetical protein Q669_10935 [Labrenzia sp. C1B10]ERS07575.1 hypothetical protein Q675_19570 [Labrenzia sp. C1B70]
MAQEPSRLDRDFQNAGELVRADALLRGTHQVDSLKPLMQRDMAFLEDRANTHRELLTALTTLFQAVTLYTFRILF